MSERREQTLGDYLTIAISPVLIMALVGSLVFFLIEVLYAGKYEGRLQWILFCFVFAAVLIARISMNPDIAGRAGLYGLIMAGCVYLGLLRYVEYPKDTPLAAWSWAINIGLIALIWWCAHRLTWDCTLIDDSTPASGAGLLEASGLESTDEDGENKQPTKGSKKKRKKKDTGPPKLALVAWWDRYRAYREAQAQKPRNPGVWIIYFSLAALPLFGLGQSLIPADDTARRRYAFWLMGIYVASGLGLLLATCYLGLRRYLRQRKLRMPAAMTGLWLLMGGSLIIALLTIGAFLPRPNAEYALVDLKSLAGSKDRKASQHAVKGDSPTKGKGKGSAEQSRDDSQAKDGQGGRRDQSAQNQRGGKGKGNSQSGQKTSGNGQSKGDRGNSSKGSNNRDQVDQKNQAKSKGDDDQQKGDKDDSDQDQSSSDKSMSQSVGDVLKRIGGVLKWIIFGAIAIVVVVYLLRSGLRFLANFTNWARRLLDGLRNFWQSLFGQRKVDEVDQEVAAIVARARAPRPFAAYRNPFMTGQADRQTPEDLVRYSFEALEALAREHDVGRQTDQTPFEFVERLGNGLPAVADDAQVLANLYAQAAYAHVRLPRRCVDQVRTFWDRLEAAAEAPLSA